MSHHHTHVTSSYTYVTSSYTYRGPKALGIFHQLPSANQSQGDIQTVSTILERVEEQREAMARKFDKKSKAEVLAYTIAY